MLNYRLGTVNEKHWGFKPVFRCSKPHTFSTFSGEEKEEKNCPFILFNKASIKKTAFGFGHLYYVQYCGIINLSINKSFFKKI